MLHLMNVGTDAPATNAGPSPASGSAVHRHRLDLGSRSSLTDAAEPWEIPVPNAERYEVGRRLVERPLRPAKAEDVPMPAMAALEAVCGPLPFERLFVIPRTTRLVSRKQCVITPAEVLAFGERTVALWVDHGPDGRVLSIPVDRLIAVDDRTILLYGRLRLMAHDRQLVVRYNTVARRDLQENLCDLRSRMATRQQPVESGFLWLDPRNEWMSQRDLPHKWRVVLEYPTVRLNLDEPATIAVGDVTEIRARWNRPSAGVAVLGSRELVIANEPSEFLEAARYGVDILAVPRERLDALGWDGRSLTVHLAQDAAVVEGAGSVSLTLDRHLIEAMRVAFGSAVRWA